MKYVEFFSFLLDDYTFTEDDLWWIKYCLFDKELVYEDHLFKKISSDNCLTILYRSDENCYITQNIFSYFELSEEFIELYADWWSVICWHGYFPGLNLSDEFIMKHKDRIGWVDIILHKRYTEKVLDDYLDEIPWKTVSRYVNVSEDFIKKHLDRILNLKVLETERILNNFSMNYYTKDYEKIKQYLEIVKKE